MSVAKGSRWTQKNKNKTKIKVQRKKVVRIFLTFLFAWLSTFTGIIEGKRPQAFLSFYFVVITLQLEDDLCNMFCLS